MLLPRPEIRIPTRFGSRIVCRGPISLGIPRTDLAVNRAAARPCFDSAYLENGFACAFGRGHDFRRPEEARRSRAVASGSRLRLHDSHLAEPVEYFREVRRR